MIRTTRSGLEYGGTSHKYFWDINYNPNATIENGLADCTTYVYGRCQEEGRPVPVKTISSAGNWHKNLTNGWKAIKYDASAVKAGDIIEWQNENHVAYVEKVSDKIYISGSFYTGMHGRAYWQGKYDERTFTTLQEMSDWMIKNYAYRFFHYVPVETESSWCGGQPDYILRRDVEEYVVDPVDRNTAVDQIEVLTNEQYVRDNNNVILGNAKAGYYNILSTKESAGYTWYEVEEDKFIAGVNGRVNYLPKTEDDELTKLRKENNELKEKLASLKAELQAIVNKI